MTLVFWTAAALVLYVYAGYPALLALWTRVRKRPVESAASKGLPAVSVVMAVRNEGSRLAGRLNNLMALDYPKRLREIIVVSDGSDDDTEQVLARYTGEVRALVLPRSGKAAALNAGVAAARNDVLVFADARQRFASDALRELVRPFADPQVGGVSGELMIDADAAPAESPVGEGVGLYWQYEKWLRERESDIGSTLGATGAIWALRRAAWRPLPAGTLLDDVLAPMRAVLDGYRVVFAPCARAFDRSSADAATEQRRKVRTLAGNYQLLRLEPRLLVPGLNPVWLQFVSHKLGRLVVPYALMALLISSAALAPAHAIYGAALALQVIFYVLAAHGAVITLERTRGARDAGAQGARGPGVGTRGARDAEVGAPARRARGTGPVGGSQWNPALAGFEDRRDQGVRE